MDSTKADTIVVVAHGDQRPGAFSNQNVKIITRSGQPLSFQEAIDYMEGKSSPGEFASSSLGDYYPLSDEDCKGLFHGNVPGEGPQSAVGLVATGSKVKVKNWPIFALRGDGDKKMSFVELCLAAKKEGTNVMILACRVPKDPGEH
ncbi:uncharacterized protein BKCO1_25000146 [Diplodia corticola]|uniref:Uncharacterized protein n=1 Tax=Diplodia corticola TaxID=236234 RepID=A0A1J9R1F9_9PEZI|nr:uncharacterized protein BKCO1_25000146 [Diplodia corticola]OJD34074.1 hypothetical protein BKCO1_25000146 [Diplodia corticola]